MEIQFYKYQGTGNDFIVLGNRDDRYNELGREAVSFICHRRFGIGADGLMMLNSHPKYDFEMKYYNSDGNESSMCGNGGRCLVKFASDLGLVKKNYLFLAIDGEHEAYISEEGLVGLKMADVSNIQIGDDHFVLNTGSPHYVTYTTGLNKLDVKKQGKEIRYSPPYSQEGINVNFIEKTGDENHLKVRTYERGVEDETFSCGTGVTACAIVANYDVPGHNSLIIETLGGDLEVSFDNENNRYVNIWLKGPALQVFKGQITLPSKF